MKSANCCKFESVYRSC